MANSADPDQFASSSQQLELHCLQRQGISWFSRTKVNIKLYHKINHKIVSTDLILPLLINRVVKLLFELRFYS